MKGEEYISIAHEYLEKAHSATNAEDASSYANVSIASSLLAIAQKGCVPLSYTQFSTSRHYSLDADGITQD